MIDSSSSDSTAAPILSQCEDLPDALPWDSLQNGPALVALVNSSGHLVRRSREWLRAVGAATQSIVELAILTDRASLKQFLEKSTGTGPAQIRFRHLHPDGRKCWYQLQPLSSGPVFLVQLLDVTDTVKRERALRSAEKMGQMGSWIMDAVTGELICSSGLLEIFELPIETGLVLKPDGEIFKSAFRPEDLNTMIKLIDIALREGRSFDQEFKINVSGHQKWIRVVGTPVEVDGRILALQGATQDISVQKKLENLADQQRERFEHTVDNIPGVVFQLVTDASGKLEFTYISRQVEHILERDPALFTKGVEWFFKLMLPEDAARLREKFERAGESLTPICCETRWVPNKTQKVKWTQVRAIPRRGESGSTVWDGILLDISNEKEIEAELKLVRMEALHASRLATIGEMAGSIAHEINTPLGAILLSAQAIQKRIGEDVLAPAIIPQAQLIEKTVDRISRIVNSLRRLSRGKELEESQVTPAKEIVDNALALCMHQITFKSIDLRVDPIPNDLMLNCQEAQITQVLVNLLSNARDAHQTTQDTSDSSLPWIHLSCAQQGAWVCFRLRDNGSGISENLASRIFDPFFTTKGPGHGTGLGLSISRKIIEAHGGQLTLESPRGPTEFLIRIPRHVVSGRNVHEGDEEIAS